MHSLFTIDIEEAMRSSQAKPIENDDAQIEERDVKILKNILQRLLFIQSKEVDIALAADKILKNLNELIHHDTLSRLSNVHKFLKSLFYKKNKIESLRNTLLEIFNEPAYDQLHETVFSLLLILAKYYPKNVCCPLLDDNQILTPENRILTISGYRFNLNALIGKLDLIEQYTNVRCKKPNVHPKEFKPFLQRELDYFSDRKQKLTKEIEFVPPTNQDDQGIDVSPSFTLKYCLDVIMKNKGRIFTGLLVGGLIGLGVAFPALIVACIFAKSIVLPAIALFAPVAIGLFSGTFLKIRQYMQLERLPSQAKKILQKLGEMFEATNPKPKENSLDFKNDSTKNIEKQLVGVKPQEQYPISTQSNGNFLLSLHMRGTLPTYANGGDFPSTEELETRYGNSLR